MNNLKKFLCGAAAVAMLSSGAVLGATAPTSDLGGEILASENIVIPINAEVNKLVVIATQANLIDLDAFDPGATAQQASAGFCMATNGDNLQFTYQFADSAGGFAQGNGALLYHETEVGADMQFTLSLAGHDSVAFGAHTAGGQGNSTAIPLNSGTATAQPVRDNLTDCTANLVNSSEAGLTIEVPTVSANQKAGGYVGGVKLIVSSV